MSIVKLQVEGSDDGSSRDGLVALKERAAGSLQAAYGFLEREGPPSASSRARVLMGVDPLDEFVAAISDAQQTDGRLPLQGLLAGGGFGGPGVENETWPEPIAGTVESLIVLADAGALRADCVESATLHLRGSQNADGSFGDPETSDSMRIFATGMIAGLLGRTTVVRPDLLQAAGDFLGPLFSPEAVEGGQWSAITAFGTFFSNVHHDLSDEALQWCGRELERGYRTHRFDAASTIRALLICDALALPGSNLDPLELLDALLGEQASDGGFAELAAGGVPHRITPTVDGIQAIVSLCRRF